MDSFLMSTYFFIEDEDSTTFFDWRDESENTTKRNISKLFRRKRP